MSFFRGVGLSVPSLPAIEGARVSLRTPQMADYEAWADLRGTSRDFLVPWEPVWPSDDLERGAYRRRLKRYASDLRDDHAYPLFVFRRTDGVLLGGLTLTNIRRGVAQTGSLGYWMGEAHAGQGYMTEAVRALLPFVFGPLGLRRIEAACLPGNPASIRLLEKVGFTREGLAREYLCIAGRWQDHLLFAMLSGDLAADSL